MTRHLAVVALLLSPLPVLAQQSARITADEAEVRAGPTPKFPVTGKLRLGDAVRVRSAKEGGWLEIEPPPGSMSWISDLVVQPLEGGRTLVVLGDADVDVFAGRTVAVAPMDAIVARLKRGTQLYALGDKVEHNHAQWWPIRPVAGEARYILATSIERPQSMSAKASPGAAALSTEDKEPRFAQAELAEKEGRWDDAERLYADLARKHRAPGGDFNFAARCEGRIEELRRTRRTGGQVASRTTARPTGQLTSTSRTGESIDRPPPLPGYTPAGGIEPAPRRSADRGTGPGMLYRSSITIDGVQAYALETRRGQLMCYVTPERGLDLEPYVNRNVELFGTFKVRGDMRGIEHLTANRVVYLGR
jgi:hypothetical protein